MKLKVLKCPDCGARLEVEVDRKSCYCQYCGCQLLVDDEKVEYTVNKNVNVNKTITKRYIDDAEIIKAKTQDKEAIRNIIILLVIVVICGTYFFVSLGFEKKKSDAEEQRLQEVVDEIMIDIENGEFDEAYVKANSLYYTEGWSDEIEKKWDNIRKATIKEIKEAEKESTGKKSFWDLFD